MANNFNSVRNSYISLISDVLKAQGDHVLVTGSQELAIPIVNADGDEGFMVLTFKIPKGSRDGDPYDGYLAEKSYALNVAKKEAKAKEAAEKKAAKIAKDAKARAAKAEAKAKREEKA